MIVQIALRTNIASLKSAVSRFSGGKKRHLVILDPSQTWLEYLGNNGILVGPHHIVSDNKGSIKSEVTSKISDHIRKCKANNGNTQRNNKVYYVNIRVNRSNVQGAQHSRTEKRTTRSNKRNNIRNPIYGLFPTATPEVNAATTPFPPDSIYNFSPGGNNNENVLPQDDSASQNSMFPEQEDQAIKNRVLETMKSTLSSTYLIRIKKEIEDVKSKGKWLKVFSRIPHTALFISELLADKNFKK